MIWQIDRISAETQDGQEVFVFRTEAGEFAAVVGEDFRSGFGSFREAQNWAEAQAKPRLRVVS